MWTEITRPKYEREGLRYASDLTDREWELIGALPAARQSRWTAANDGSARGGQRDPVFAALGLSVAHAAEELPATLDGAALLLYLAGRRDMAADQSSSVDGGARGRVTGRGRRRKR